MDKIVKETNYFNPTEEQIDAHNDAIEDDKFEELKEGEVTKALNALAEKLKSKQWPQRNSDGQLMIERFIKRIGESVSEIDESVVINKISPSIFKAAESCIQMGLPAALIDILQELLNILPDSYYENMPRERYLQALSLIKMGCYKPQKNDESADYAESNCYDPIRNIITAINEEIHQKYIDDAVQFCHYIILQMFRGDGDSVGYFNYILYCFRLQCDGNPFLSLRKDPKKLKEYLEEYAKLIETCDIKNDEMKEMIEETYGIVFKLLRSDEDVKAVGPTLAPFAVEMIGRLHASEGKKQWLRKTIDRLVYSLLIDDKDAVVVFKSVKTEVVLDIWKKYFHTPDKSVKSWEKEVIHVFRHAIIPCIRTPQACQLLFPVIEDLLKWRSKSTCEAIKRELREIENPVKTALKENISGFVSMLKAHRNLISTMTAKEEEEDDDNTQENLAGEVEDLLEEWLKLARSAKQHKKAEVQNMVILILCDILRSGVDDQAKIGSEIAEFVDWNLQEDVKPVLDALMILASGKAGANWESVMQGSLVADILSPLCEKAREKQKLLLPHLKLIGELIDASLKGELWFDLNGSEFPSYHTHILLNFFNMVTVEVSDAEVIEVIYPRLLRGIKAAEDFNTFHEVWSLLSVNIKTKGAGMEAFCKYIPTIVEYAEAKVKDRQLQYCLPAGSTLATLCMEKPKHVEPHLDLIINLLDSCISPDLLAISIQLLRALEVVSKSSNKVLTEKLMDICLKCLNDEALCYNAVALLTAASQEKHQLLLPLIEKLRDIATQRAAHAPSIFDIFERLVEKEKSSVERVMAALESSVNPLLRSAMPPSAVSALTVMRRIGINFPDALSKRKKVIEGWKNEPALRDVATHLLDVIADRTLAGVDAAVAVQSTRVTQVDEKLKDTSKKVEQTSSEVNKQKVRVGAIEERQDNTERRVDDLEENVEEIGKEVDDLDNKTMTNAPRWSRPVSVLLNVESDKDWRLLAQRLGFSPADIRGWATQHDPCMAVLSDWFATNRTAGATHAVRTALKEMNRLDALALVEDAVEEAEGTVADGPEEYTSPPPIFLSYQWGHQPEAKMLRRHLEMAGYPCWMDVGNMGGGDKLYEAIDRGLRGAAVMIACVTPKYAQSENCRRELNLAANINKPIIPLQMLRMEWPPAGPMGPLLSEYLFIRVFSKTAVESGPDKPFWPSDRFVELLMQIRLHVAPDHELVRAPYERWWEPPEEVIVVPKRDNKEIVNKQTDTVPANDDAAPEVFLSYQWGKQTQVKRLFEKLTGLGVRCWMDIFQMGGGDSLYDKIDRGIRACTVMVACVTPKYALSANCRKEVSLAHALKKPIIPLMLDQTDWPPAGPMSMVFTELLYIGLHKSPGEQDSWDGPKSAELFGKLREFGVLPGVAVNQENTSSPNKSKKEETMKDKPKETVPTSAETNEKSKQSAQSTPKKDPSPSKQTEEPKKKSSTCDIL